jgi:uncharacterized protein (TIGR00251 family)
VESAVLEIRVIPRARRTAVDGERNGAILIRLAAAPVDGAANEALIEFLSETLRLPRRAITIVGGDKSRTKRVQIAGLDAAAVRSRLLQ